MYTLGAIVLLAMTALTVRLWQVQVNEHDKWASKLRKSSQDIVRIPAPRGHINDRNGVTLVENRLNFKVDFYLPDVEQAYRNAHDDVPVNVYQARVRGMLRELEEPNIVEIVEKTVIPKLENLNVAEEWSTVSLRNHYRQRRFVPFTFSDDVDFETLARLSERSVDAAGVNVSENPVRHYVYESLACHILGYTGQIQNLEDEPDIKEFTRAGYAPDEVGVSQVELRMDRYLRGTPGRRILQRNPKGVVEGEVGRVEPVQGAEVFLTIDARIQHITEMALRDALRGRGRAAAVVVNPNNGDVLAMASLPSFDPNKFVPRIPRDQWEQLNDDPSDPLLNRALLPFAPGSTYKIVVALAGLSENLGANTFFSCGGGVSYGNTFMRCWNTGGHGTLGLREAIMRSCNSYFYKFGNAAGADAIVRVGKVLGLGEVSGLGLIGEWPGILPGPDWLKENHPRERWSEGFTANTSIGQGYVLATPLQMAMVAATVANGGTSYAPRLIDKVVAQDGSILLQEESKIRGHLSDFGITPDEIEVVRRGMRDVVNSGGGTAGRARVKGMAVAGKTGTAQVWRVNENGVRLGDNHVWFISFAPYETPQLAVCVLVANGQAGGRVAAPIAARIINESTALEKGYTPKLVALEPAKGGFSHFDVVSYANNVPGEYAADGEDFETTDHVADVGQPQPVGRSQAPEPQIAPAPDRRMHEGGERPSFFERMGRTLSKPFRQRRR